MKLTLLHHTHKGMNRYPVSGIHLLLWALVATVFIALLSVYVTVQYLSSTTVENKLNFTKQALNSMQAQIKQSEQEVKDSRRMVQMQMDEVTRKVGFLQADVMRINAVGKRLLLDAGISPDEFDFDSIPAIGGRESIVSEVFVDDLLTSQLNNIDIKLKEKENQLAILESVLLNREMTIASYISGRPVTKGWNSSVFGQRIDPFSGHTAWHEGMDFAGKEDDPIVATAAGVVSFSGYKSGYGKTIEISHGNGIKTRYGHNKQLLVDIGSVVAKGDVIATMGSSGRSTGPHVHYEVLKKDRAVDPKKYVWRKSK